ncbi:hypothetical protein XHC_2718 [Xanthomonas hortorum pv. carotae str. M081]|nr:hypothetical protein XHC_2718 [Xanthomonas hortorum pv. carotae str. M081]
MRAAVVLQVFTCSDVLGGPKHALAAQRQRSVRAAPAVFEHLPAAPDGARCR